MKLALFHPWIWLKGGAEKVCLETLKRSKHDIDIFTMVWDKEQSFPEFEDYKDKIKIIEKNFKMDSFARKGMRAGLKLMFKKIDFSKYDGVIISSGGIGELLAIRNHKVPIGIYSHTPLRILHDKPVIKSNFERIPAYMKALYVFLAGGYAILEKIAWNKFSLVMTNSNNTKQRILDGNLAKDVKVIYPGVDTRKFNYFPNLERKPYFFVPGRITFHKRPDLAIKSFNLFKEKHPDWYLVLAGNTRAENKDYINDIYKLAGPRVQIMENVTDEEMVQLYENAYGTLFMPINEDFGITPIESLSCGTPVIAVNEGGVKESVKDGRNGFLVHANEHSIANKMLWAVENQNDWNAMREKCWLRAQFFDWPNYISSFDRAVENWLYSEPEE